MSTESDEEFAEDFGYSLRPADVDRLLERARASGDQEVRLLCKQFQTLRRTAADLLMDLEARGLLSVEESGPGQPVSYPAGFLQFLLRDEPRTPRV